MLSIVIPTMQKNIDVLNKLVIELVDDDVIDEIVIIDNSLKGYEFDSSKVKVIIPKKNLYVNPAWNLGIKNINNEYFGILNDDILLPKNFCSQVYEFLKNTNNTGLIGLDSTILHNTPAQEFDTYPKNAELKFQPCEYRMYTKYWGSAIFGKKENYYNIPENIKIWCGDHYLMKTNKDNKKINYEVVGGAIKHLSSLSSKDPAFASIKETDVYNYAQIDRDFKKHNFYRKRIHFAERIFSIRNSYDQRHKVISLLGVKLSIRKKRKNRYPKNAKNIKQVFNEKLNGSKIAAVVAMHNNNAIIDDNLIKYLSEVKKYTGFIVIAADHPIIPSELEKVKNIVDAVIFIKHYEYDFGSYKRGYFLLKKLDLLQQINNIVFLNDSVIYIGDNLSRQFKQLQEKDFYGLTVNSYGYTRADNSSGRYGWGFSPHIQSYFFSVSSKIFNTQWFYQFMQKIKYEREKEDIIINYEMGLSKLILSHGFSLNSFYPVIREKNTAPCEMYLSLENADIFIKKSLLKTTV